MRVLLLGVTGWANPSLRAMIARSTPPTLLATRAESAPSPHFPCENLSAEARRLGVPLVEDATDDELIARFPDGLDLVLSVGFHRKLGPAVAALAPLAVNVHPSLLPAYRGSAPTNWMLLHGETIAGATVHELTQRIDGGDIILQRAFPIGAGETAGELRARQAELMAEMVVDLLTRIERHEPLPRTRQDERLASRFPKMTPAEGILDLRAPAEEIVRRFRATTPWPGARVALASSDTTTAPAEARATCIRALGPALGAAGTIHSAESGTLIVSVADATLEIELEHAAVLSAAR